MLRFLGGNVTFGTRILHCCVTRDKDSEEVWDDGSVQQIVKNYLFLYTLFLHKLYYLCFSVSSQLSCSCIVYHPNYRFTSSSKTYLIVFQFAIHAVFNTFIEVILKAHMLSLMCFVFCIEFSNLRVEFLEVIYQYPCTQFVCNDCFIMSANT